MPVATILIGLGLIFTLAGLFGVVWCIRYAQRMKSGEMSEDEIKAGLMKLSAVNMGSMGGAMLGLSMLLVGLIL